MQGSPDERKFAGERAGSSPLEFEAESQVLAEIQPLVSAHGIGAAVLAGAFREALHEIRSGKQGAHKRPEDHRSCLIGLILWKIFAKGSALWIDSKTESGNAITLDIRVTAYAIWDRAAAFAVSRNLDLGIAADTLALAVRMTADRLATEKVPDSSDKVRDLKKFMFKIYMNKTYDLLMREGAAVTDNVDFAEFVTDRDVSDEGAFIEGLHRRILCGEFLDAMPEMGREVAIVRHALGYNWQDTAENLDTSVNAAQKALSVGIRKVAGTCLRELRRIGSGGIARAEAHLLKIRREQSSGE